MSMAISRTRGWLVHTGGGLAAEAALDQWSAREQLPCACPPAHSGGGATTQLGRSARTVEG